MSEWRPRTNPWLITLAVMLATFMEVMDTSIASVAVPYIAGSVSATYNEATWVLTSYLVANAVFLPASTWFAMKFGRKRFLMFSVVVFTVASFGCGIAGSLGFILIARAIQGAGGGALQPLSQAILMESFPPEKQGMAMGMFAVGVVVAPVIGPAFGGYLTDAISWRWAFYINIPVGILALILQSKFLEDPPYISKADPGPLDKYGLGLLAIWAGAMQFMCDKGQEEDWFGSNLIRWAAVAFTVAFAIFLVRELTHRNPLLNLRILANRNFGIGCLVIFLFGSTVYAITTILPLFYQTLMGYDATTAGLAVSPRGLGSLVGALLAGRLVAKIDARPLMAVGFALIAWACLWNASMTLQISPSSLVLPIMITGFGFAFIFVPLSGAALGTVPQKEMQNASGLYNLLRNLGGSIGIAVSSTLTQRHLQTHRNEISRSLTGSSPALRNELTKLTHFMRLHTGPVKSSLRAMSVIERQLNAQAQLWAYVDVFRYMAVLSVLCIPVVFLLSKARRQGGAE
jgi:DHA2 family multidrug resistance protein